MVLAMGIGGRVVGGGVCASLEETSVQVRQWERGQKRVVVCAQMQPRKAWDAVAGHTRSAVLVLAIVSMEPWSDGMGPSTIPYDLAPRPPTQTATDKDRHTRCPRDAFNGFQFN